MLELDSIIDSIQRSQDSILIKCSCENKCSHASFHIFRSPILGDNIHSYAEFAFTPIGSFWARLKQAWKVLRGKKITTTHYWSKETYLELAEWMTHDTHYQLLDTKKDIQSRCLDIIKNLR